MPAPCRTLTVSDPPTNEQTNLLPHNGRDRGRVRLFPLPPTGGPMQTRIQIWLHKPTNVRYRLSGTNGAAYIMQSLSHRPRTVSEAELCNHEIWSKV